MTTQVLMSTPSVIEKPVISAVSASEPKTITAPDSLKPKTPPIADRLVAPSSCPIWGMNASNLPYRANHQAQYLCLQAEVDALLYQVLTVRNEKQSNSVSS